MVGVPCLTLFMLKNYPRIYRGVVTNVTQEALAKIFRNLGQPSNLADRVGPLNP